MATGVTIMVLRYDQFTVIVGEAIGLTNLRDSVPICSMKSTMKILKTSRPRLSSPVGAKFKKTLGNREKSVGKRDQSFFVFFLTKLEKYVNRFQIILTKQVGISAF